MIAIIIKIIAIPPATAPAIVATLRIFGISVVLLY
jgi:hypothetical protein